MAEPLNHKQLADRVPLVTLCWESNAIAYYKGGALPVTHTDSNHTAMTEDACGWQRSRYFFAGHAHLEFGNVCLAYGEKLEQDHSGHVGPCDSGGTYGGNIYPGRDMDDDACRRWAVEVLCNHAYELANWRSRFEDYLSVFFDDPWDYLRPTTPPRHGATWGTQPEVPAADERNHPAHCPDGLDQDPPDWRAWVWEARLYEAHPFPDHLAMWSCLSDVVPKLEATHSDDAAWSAHVQTLLSLDFLTDDNDPWAPLRDWINQEICK